MAALCAALAEYWPSRAGSITRCSRSGWRRYGRAQSTRCCSRPRRRLSTLRRPVSSSSSTTPKLYTSLFAVRCPACVYITHGQLLIVTNLRTSEDVLRRGVAVGPHDAGGDVGVVALRALLGQAKIRELCRVILRFT
ncbi:hypothetical protein U9M48_021725 [Paspalum notatum var. saurae]|uniref:Uncharacterized protein n=1 Tax=Paspalum notatum var. saurae TaxID=547442 RepID=A0AAQ3TK85_PASNO